MVTLVGTQKDFSEALKELIELDYDAAEAYRAAIKRVKEAAYKVKLEAFLEDHERHIRELSAVVIQQGKTPPQGPDIKQHLLKGKVIATSMINDKAILKAMKDNEADTNTAYERLNQHVGQWPSAIAILKRGLEDEQRHKAWLEDVT